MCYVYVTFGLDLNEIRVGDVIGYWMQRHD